jgi:hypothetical protein
MYAVAVMVLVRQIEPPSPRLANAAAVVLLLNPLSAVLLVDALTESLTLISAVSLAAIALRLDVRGGPWRYLTLLMAGCLVASFSVMVRPANIVLFVAWALGVALFIASEFRDRRRAWAAASIVVWIVCSGIVFAPQLMYNVAQSGRATILPTAELGAIQFAWGIKVQKYATQMTGPAERPGADSLIYANPAFKPDEQASPSPLQWYLRYPVNGIATILLHLFNSFNWDYPFVYIYCLTPVYGPYLTFLVWVGTLLGLAEIILQLRAGRKTVKGASSATLSAITFVAATCILTTLMNCLVGVENRFGIIPTTVLLTMSCVWVQRARFEPFPRLAGTLLSALALSGLALWFSETVVKSYAAPIVAARDMKARP